MQKGKHKVPKRSYRLTPDLDKIWAEYLADGNLSHNQEVKKAIAAYLFHNYPQLQKG